MAGVRRSDFSEAMKQDMYDYFLDWEDKYMEIAPVYTQLFDIVQSQAAYEIYNSAIGLGDLLEKPEGMDLVADAPLEGYTIYCKNRTFGRQVRFTMEHVQDNQKFPDFLRTVVGSWRSALERTKDRFYVTFFNKGALTAGHSIFNNTITGLITDSSGDFIYDGLPFFDTAHPDKVGGTYVNHTASRALNHDNLETTWLTYHSTNNRDERANEIELMANTLVIPPQLKFTADRILKSDKRPDSADNDMNAMYGIVEPLVWQRLTDTDGWYLGARMMGLMGTDRMAPEMDFYQDETSKDYYATIIYRFGGCITNWRHWYACNVSAT